MNSLWLAFITGLTTGGLSCLAVQGGLLTSSLEVKKEEELLIEAQKKPFHSRFYGIGIFLLAKLAAYSVLGFLLGMAGSTLLLTPKILGLVQIFAGLYMLATAARMFELHPIFRYTAIQPPAWIYKFMKKRSRETHWFTPAVLGLLTVFIPCGVTQATMAVAVASANPWLGASIMGAFVLGTSPIFFALGATVVGLMKRKIFSYAAAGVVALFGLLSINGGLGLQGSVYTLQNFYKAAVTPVEKLLASGGEVAGVSSTGEQEVLIDVKSNGYTTSATTLKVAVPVRLKLQTNATQGCSRAFTIPDLNISKVLPATGEEEIVFTPRRIGRLAFACSMGMYTGEFTVIP